MKVSEHQVGMVIKTYMKHSRERFANTLPFSSSEDPEDVVQVSEAAKRILYERIGKLVIEKAREQASIPDTESAGS
jgi:hypothetical protein